MTIEKNEPPCARPGCGHPRDEHRSIGRWDRTRGECTHTDPPADAAGVRPVDAMGVHRCWCLRYIVHRPAPPKNKGRMSREWLTRMDTGRIDGHVVDDHLEGRDYAGTSPKSKEDPDVGNNSTQTG